MQKSSLDQSVVTHIKESPGLPGVYRMINDDSKILYVGKAKNLNNRLRSYLNVKDSCKRIQVMISQTVKIEYIVVKTEVEALLLEAKLIKSLKPKYNILLRDDKSLPYIEVTMSSKYPRILKHQTKTFNKKSKFFGPFAQKSYLMNMIQEVTKIFKIRTCTDSYFKTRNRPCLQYDILRCSAPCVGKISQDEYMSLVSQMIRFLEGNTAAVLSELTNKMMSFSEKQDYERAASIRDVIKIVKALKYRSDLVSTNLENADVICIVKSEKQVVDTNLTDEGVENSKKSSFSYNLSNNLVDTDVDSAKDVNSALDDNGYIFLIQIFIFRDWQFLGNTTFVPENTFSADFVDVLNIFLSEFYRNTPPPKEIIVHKDILASIDEHDEYDLNYFHNMSYVLRDLHYLDYIPKVIFPKIGDKYKVSEYVKYNADIALQDYLVKNSKILEKLNAVAEIFQMSRVPKRIEVYDNSHIMGKFPVGVMIVVEDGEFVKSEYRKYNIKTTGCDVKGGDDYQMLREVLTRRVKRIVSDQSRSPDLMIIDGGKGHLGVAKNVLKSFNIDNVKLVSMAKGVERNKGNEMFFTDTDNIFTVKNSNTGMRFLQVMRDEAHNFAIRSHRSLRDKL